jgi:Transposase DDE domain
MSQVKQRSKAVAPEFEVPKELSSGHVLKVLKGHLATLRAQRAHPNRTLFYDDLLVGLLIGAYEPCINSLRTLDDASVSQNFLHSQITSRRLAKSTLSDAMATMDPKCLLPILKRLLVQVPNLQRRDPDLAGLGRILAVDGSHFRMAVDVLWAMARKKADGQKGCSVRLNLQLDVLEFVPADFSISGQGDGSEGRAFLAQGIRPEAVYLADRAFVDMAFITGVLDAGADLVVRMHGDTRFEKLYSQPLDPEDREAHVVLDAVGTMKRIGSRHLREVVVTDPRSGKSVRLLTSLLDVPAKVIGKLYRHRWIIELFFRWLKCVARVRHLISDSRNGVTLQFYTAMIAVLAGYIVTGTKPGLYEYNMLCGVMRGTTIESGMLEVLARRARERELERLRKARKKQA